MRKADASGGMIVLGAVLLCLSFVSEVIAFNDSIGFAALQAELGLDMPDGAGIAAEHVEASAGGSNNTYMPDPTAPELANDSFVDETGLNTAYSSHARYVGRNWYGSGGVSPAVGNTTGNQVHSYLADNWLALIWDLRTGVGDVINNSWIGELATPSGTATMLNKLDRQVRVYNKQMFSGVNNGAGLNSGETSALAWASYNGIAFGRTDGNHKSGRPNPIYGTATKPDLVAPEGATSYATPVGAGTGSLLLQEARDRGWANAERPDVIKAIMMAGATKTVGWAKGDPNDPSDDPTYPLDPVYGAGQVNVYKSWHILDAAEQDPADVLVDSIGWDAGRAKDNEALKYFFEVNDQDGADISAILTWLEPAAASGDDRSLAYNLDLALYLADDQAGEYVLDNLMQQSISTLDNVEHIWFRGLPAGYYALEVSSSLSYYVDFALAWNSGASDLPSIPGDADGDGDVDVVDLGALAGNYNTASGATWQMGDFDLDGDVDLVDLGALAGNYGFGTNFSGPLGFDADYATFFPAVPEPATCAFLILGFILCPFTTNRRRR